MMPPQPVSRIDQLDAEIKGEQARWAEMGINVTPEFVLNCRLKAFTIALGQLGIDEDALNLILNEIVIEQMKVVREEIESQQAAQKAQLLVPSKKLLGPDGAPVI